MRERLVRSLGVDEMNGCNTRGYSYSERLEIPRKREGGERGDNCFVG